MSDLLKALEMLHNSGVSVETVRSVISELFVKDEFEDSDEKKFLAVCADRIDNGNGFTADIEQSRYDDCTFDVDGETWLVCDDDEKEERWDAALESYLDEGCVDGADSPYFDRERWKNDARIDGDGHTLSGYDGNVNEFNDGKEWFYLYRQN